MFFNWGMKFLQRNTHQWYFHLYMLVFLLFITLRNKFHGVHLNNLYMSAKFAHHSYTHQNCVKVHGVFLTSGWVIIRGVLQNKLHDKKAVYLVW